MMSKKNDAARFCWRNIAFFYAVLAPTASLLFSLKGLWIQGMFYSFAAMLLAGIMALIEAKGEGD